MSRLTIYTYLDEDNMPYVEVYRGDELLRVLEGGSDYGSFTPPTTDVVLVHVDWNEVKVWDAGNIDQVEDLVSALSRLPKDRERSELLTIQEWLEVNEPEDFGGSEGLWMTTVQRVADRLALLS